MKNISLLSIFLIGCITLFAQQDPEAKKILDKLSEETKSHTVIQTNFEIIYKNIKDNNQNTSSGSIVMKDNMYHMNFMGTESFFDGKTLWSYLPEVNEVNISEPEPDSEDIFSNPKKLFTIYESGYKYQHINTVYENNVNYSIVDLYPVDLTEDFSRIRLQINSNDLFLKSATIFGKDGSHYIISFNNYNTNTNFSDSYFVFNSKNYPDIEIIDMR